MVSAAASEVEKLAALYTSTALGAIDVHRQGVATIFDFGEWKSSVATRKNEDCTISFVTVDPGGFGFEFVVGKREGK